jgi:non-homologous end joining protein Ku
MNTVEHIIDRLSGRLIPEEMTVSDRTPPGYERKLQNAYRKKMRRRAHRLLQSTPPSDRESILRFLENEEEVRDAKSFLDDIGYSEVSVEKMNDMAQHLIASKTDIVNQAHSGLLEKHELMSVFVGGASEARASSHRD